jgi:hypothetical protein
MYISVNFMCLTPDGSTGPVNASPKDFDSTFNDAIDAVKEELKNYKAEDLALHMTLEYEDQCCLEFKPEQIKAIADLGVTFTADCWETDKS